MHTLSILFAVTLLATMPISGIAETRYSDPVISIIIDDLGYKHHEDFRVVDLPAPIICAIMPHTPFAQKVAYRAHESGKEIILHVPMEAEKKNKYLGPGALTVKMSKDEFIQTLRNNLKNVPLAIGLNNHMGSLLTRYPEHMQWLMLELKQQGYVYIDSMTSNQSIANMIARENEVPYLIRDVFLDHEVTPHHIKGQLEKLVNKAKQKGYAVGIGHPHPETLDAIESFITQLHRTNIKIISLKEMLEYRQQSSATVRTTSLPETIIYQ